MIIETWGDRSSLDDQASEDDYGALQGHRARR